MSLWLQIYLLGYLLAFIECILIFRDDKGMINWVGLVVAIFAALLSWILAFALWVGMNIKHGQERDKKNKDEEDKFFGDDLAGST
jgi:hypothetical protein